MSDREHHAALAKMVDKLVSAAEERLLSVVLYGPAVRARAPVDQLHLLIVLRDLSLEAVESIGAPVRWWMKTGHHMPRLFSPDFMAKAIDVFPIEFLDLRANRVILHGDDLFGDLRVGSESLRYQCERELREKLMRLQEGFLEANHSKRELEWLMTRSYSEFVRVFRGCLHLLENSEPRANHEVMGRFCDLAGLDRGPFSRIESLTQEDGHLHEPASLLFARYYEQLGKAVDTIDRIGKGHQECARPGSAPSPQ
jgi:hypothetical protein